MVEGVVRWNEALILRADSVPLAEFIGFVTAYRASSEFHISTLLRGFCSFRAAMAELLSPPNVEPQLAFSCLRVVDDAYLTAIFQMGDEYVDKLNRTITERRVQLEADLQRVAAEREREFQEAMTVIQKQRSLLHEVSLPVISVFQGVLVMPLIGSIDSDRARQIIETLLSGIAAQRARLALLDITGVRTVDTHVASTLLHAARAAKLLGAEVILTGINAEVASALVKLGIGLGDIVTRSTLESGIAYAYEALNLNRR